MRKCFLLVLVLFATFSFAGLAQAAPRVVLDGQTLNFDVPPTVENDRTMVPLRAIFEALDAEVNWDDATQTVTARRDNTELKLAIGGKAFKNGTPVNLDVPAKIINGRTMVPLRFVSETIGCQVSWDDATQTVSITNAGGKNNFKVNANESKSFIHRFQQRDNNVSNDASIKDIEDTLNDYFEDGGNDYFADDGIDVAISLDGDEDDLAYVIKLDFSDADVYDDLTEVSANKIKTFLNAVRSKIYTEIDGTGYEDADITGKLVDNDQASYHVKYNGSSYTFSWD